LFWLDGAFAAHKRCQRFVCKRQKTQYRRLSKKGFMKIYFNCVNKSCKRFVYSFYILKIPDINGVIDPAGIPEDSRLRLLLKAVPVRLKTWKNTRGNW